MSHNLTIEDKLIAEWLKDNKPNAYFDTVTDRRTDNLIGVGVSYIENDKKISDVIIKRRSMKNTNCEVVHYYFTKGNKSFTKDELLVAKEPDLG